MALERTTTSFPRYYQRERVPPIEDEQFQTSGDRKTVFPRSGQNIFQPRKPRPPIARQRNPASEDLQITNGRPWSEFKAFLQEEQSGPVLVAYGYSSHRKYVIKERRAPESELQLLKTRCSNLLEIVAAFREGTELFFVYDYTAASLSDIVSTPLHALEANQIGLICHEVVEALVYIHGALMLGHGNVNPDNVLISATGEIKLSDIGDCLLRGSREVDTNQRKDAKSVGTLMVYMMEPGTSWQFPDDVKIRDRRRWEHNQAMLDFLDKTYKGSVMELKADGWLMSQELVYGIGHSLIPHVCVAERYRKWKSVI